MLSGGSTYTLFFYDGWQDVEETTSGGTVVRRYVYGEGIDEVLRATIPDNASDLDDDSVTAENVDIYYHDNSIGSVVAVTNASGTVLESYRYEAFGQATIFDQSGAVVSTTQVGQPFMFTGRRLDWEEGSGLLFYRLRYYDPAAGRFISRDPLGLWGDPGQRGNGQSYCGNNPVNRVDPMGLLDVIVYNSTGTDYSLADLIEKLKLDQDNITIVYRTVIPETPEAFAAEITGKEVVIFLTHGNSQAGIKTDNTVEWPVNDDQRLSAADVAAACAILAPAVPEAVFIVGCDQCNVDPKMASTGKAFKAGGVPLVAASNTTMNVERQMTPGSPDNAGVAVVYIRELLQKLSEGMSPEDAGAAALAVAQQFLETWSDIEDRGLPLPLPDTPAQGDE